PKRVRPFPGKEIVIRLADDLGARDVEQLLEAAIDEQESTVRVLEVHDGRGVIQDSLKPLFTLAQGFVSLSLRKGSSRQIVRQLLQTLIAVLELLVQLRKTVPALGQLRGPSGHALFKRDVERLQLIRITTTLAFRLS